LDVTHLNTELSDVLVFDNRVVSMPKGNMLINKAFEISIPKGKTAYQIVLNGLADGNWYVKGSSTRKNFNVEVLPGKNTVFFTAKAGNYKIGPGTDNRFPFQKPDRNIMPK